MKPKVVVQFFWLDLDPYGCGRANIKPAKGSLPKQSVESCYRELETLACVDEASMTPFDLQLDAAPGQQQLFKEKVVEVARKHFRVVTVVDNHRTVETRVKQSIDVTFAFDVEDRTACTHASFRPKRGKITDTTRDLFCLFDQFGQVDFIRRRSAIVEVRVTNEGRQSAFTESVLELAKKHFKITKVNET